MSVDRQPSIGTAGDEDCGHDPARREVLMDIWGKPAERLGNVCWWCHVCDKTWWGPRA